LAPETLKNRLRRDVRLMVKGIAAQERIQGKITHFQRYKPGSAQKIMFSF
jgi:hypothetical protein